MIHINKGDEPHIMLTREEAEEKHPDFFKRMNRPTPFKAQGKTLFDIRVTKDGYLNMRDMAKAIGIDVVELSESERGIIEVDWDERAKLYRTAIANRVKPV